MIALGAIKDGMAVITIHAAKDANYMGKSIAALKIAILVIGVNGKNTMPINYHSLKNAGHLTSGAKNTANMDLVISCAL